MCNKVLFFFFQEEDGIRDKLVTGVQTCALPISRRQRLMLRADRKARAIEPHLQRVAETDERVTREPLAALDALEQKARLERGELHERRHRRVQITGYVEE